MRVRPIGKSVTKPRTPEQIVADEKAAELAAKKKAAELAAKKKAAELAAKKKDRGGQ